MSRRLTWNAPEQWIAERGAVDNAIAFGRDGRGTMWRCERDATQHKQGKAMDDEKQLAKEKEKFAAATGHEPSSAAVDDRGWTDLHHAAALNMPVLTTSLLHSGADVNAEDKEKMTPLHSASMENAVEIPRILLDNGADVNAKDKDGLTPLHSATMRNAIAAAELLLDNGADVNAKNYYSGLTPLHIATMRNVVAVAKFLLEHGADVNAKNYHDGLTPLHIATMRNVFGVAELLLEHGADVNAKTSEGWTPLFLATHKKDTVSVLLRFFGFETRMVRLLRWHGGEE